MIKEYLSLGCMLQCQWHGELRTNQSINFKVNFKEHTALVRLILLPSITAT